MKIFVTCLFILGFTNVFAQQQKIDSLLAVNNAYTKEDSIKVVHLINVFRQYRRLELFDKVEEYGQKAIAIAKKLPYTYSLTTVYEKLGLCYHGASKYFQAIDNYTKGIDVALKRNDKRKAATFYLNLGALYNTLPDYAKSLEANQVAVSFYNELKDNNYISSCYMNIGTTYQELKQFGKAVEYIEKALSVFKMQVAPNLPIAINYGTAIANKALGNVYAEVNDAEARQLTKNSFGNSLAIAFEYLNTALQVAQAIKDESLTGSVYTDIGKLYEKLNKNEQALQQYEKALVHITNDNAKDELGDLYFTMGCFFINTKSYLNAMHYLRKSLQLGYENNLLSTQRNALEKMSIVYEHFGSYDSAVITYKKYIVIRDSIYGKEKEKEITRKQLELDFAVKENAYKLNQQIINAKLQQQILLAKQQQQQLQLNKQKLEIVNKEKDVQRLTYLQEQTKLKNDKALQASLLQKNILQTKLDKELSSKQIDKQQQQLELYKKEKQFFVLGMLLLFFIVGLVVFNYQKTKKLNETISLQKSELEQINIEKDKIFSVVSHDLLSPVNSLLSFQELLKYDVITPDKMKIYAHELNTRLDATAALMTNLIKWSATQMQGFKTNIQRLNLLVKIQTVLQYANMEAAKKNIAIVIDVPENIFVLADKEMLILVIRNIINNAIKFSYEHSTIQISAKQNNGMVELYCRDAGVGFSPNQLHQINNTGFTTLETTLGTNEEKGTGLGLMLSKTFLQLMGGTLTADNIEKGCVLKITLPKANA